MEKKIYTPISVPLKRRPDRLIVDGILRKFNNDKTFDKVPLIVDTGCKNTLVPLRFANLYGRATTLLLHTTVGQFNDLTKAYFIDRLDIGGFSLCSALMFAADFKGELADAILLGLNTMNEWEYTASQKSGIFKFNENEMSFSGKMNRYSAYYTAKGDTLFAELSLSGVSYFTKRE